MTKTAATTISELATATPAEIDTEIARIQGEHAALEAEIQRNNRSLHYADEAGDRAAMNRFMDLIVRAGNQQAELDKEMRPLTAEWTRRHGWTRYYLVDSHDGHVHSSTGCSSCFPTTAFYWLTSESGKTAEQIVTEAQAQACTVCFPWAPVTDKRGSYRTPSQAQAEARAAEKAAKAAAKKAAEITTPDGGELYAARTRWNSNGALQNDDRLRTEASAWRRALSDSEALAFYGSSHPDAAAWTETINRCVAALAVRRQVSEQSLRDQIAAKAAAKAKRDGWEIQS